MIRAALQFIAGAVLAALALACAGVPLPRLLGTGCTAYPFAVALAREESEIRGTCAAITPMTRS